MKPSDLKSIHPYGSVLHKSEHETIARNIALILSRNGNTFRLLPFSEYEESRRKDRASASDLRSEKPYFDEAVRYLQTEQTARIFSPRWDLKLENEPAPSIEKFARLFDLPKGQLLYWIDSEDDQYAVHVQTYQNGVQMSIKGYVSDRELAIQKMEGIT